MDYCDIELFALETNRDYSVVFEIALQIAVKRREAKSKGEKERYKHLNAEFQRIARRDKKAFFSNQCKEIEEKNRMGKTRVIFRKIRDTKGIFHAKMGLKKDRNGTYHDTVQKTEIKTIPMEKKCKKAKWLSEEALQIVVKRRERKSKGEEERYTHLKADFQRIARRDKKAFFSDQYEEIEEKNRMGKTRDLFKKIRDTKGTFHERWAQ